jgi:hypothetical protein
VDKGPAEFRGSSSHFRSIQPNVAPSLHLSWRIDRPTHLQHEPHRLCVVSLPASGSFRRSVSDSVFAASGSLTETRETLFRHRAHRPTVPQHAGTLDLDIVVDILILETTEAYKTLEENLRKIGFDNATTAAARNRAGVGRSSLAAALTTGNFMLFDSQCASPSELLFLIQTYEHRSACRLVCEDLHRQQEPWQAFRTAVLDLSPAWR